MSENNNDQKKIKTCWVCLRVNPSGGISYCPQSFGMHNDPPIENWINSEKSYSDFFPDKLTAPICWDCAH